MASESLIIVSREREAVFDTLQEHFHDEPEVRVMWDRRIAERRTSQLTVPTERRHANRRRPSPATWQTLGILVTIGGREERRSKG